MAREMSEEDERLTFELILVDDGSADGTLEVMRSLQGAPRKCFDVRWTSFSRNFGKEASMLAGLRMARGDYVTTMDADMQDPPSLLPKMLSILRNNDRYDCVATRRITRVGESLVRSFFARLFYRIINRLSETEFVDGARDYRLMRRRMVDAVLSLGEYNRF